jgi:hypothetical protein
LCQSAQVASRPLNCACTRPRPPPEVPPSGVLAWIREWPYFLALQDFSVRQVRRDHPALWPQGGQGGEDGPFWQGRAPDRGRGRSVPMPAGTNGMPCSKRPVSAGCECTTPGTPRPRCCSPKALTRAL